MWPMGAQPIGKPGWPEFAFSTASIAKNLIVFTDFSIKVTSSVADLSRDSTADAITAVRGDTREDDLREKWEGLYSEEEEEEYKREVDEENLWVGVDGLRDVGVEMILERESEDAILGEERKLDSFFLEGFSAFAMRGRRWVS